MDDRLFLKKQNGQGLEISPSVIGKQDERKFQTFAMWSAQEIDGLDDWMGDRWIEWLTWWVDGWRDPWLRQLTHFIDKCVMDEWCTRSI